MKRGTAVELVSDAHWRAVVTGSGTQGVPVRWTRGPLRGKDARVPRELLRKVTQNAAGGDGERHSC